MFLHVFNFINCAACIQVTNFAVFLKGVGGIRWDEPVDVRGLHLDHVIKLSKGCVEVYLDEEEKPELGEGLNKPATVHSKPGSFVLHHGCNSRTVEDVHASLICRHGCVAGADHAGEGFQARP